MRPLDLTGINILPDKAFFSSCPGFPISIQCSQNTTGKEKDFSWPLAKHKLVYNQLIILIFYIVLEISFWESIGRNICA